MEKHNQMLCYGTNLKQMFSLTEAHLEKVFLFWFELIGPGNQKPLLCDLVDVCVIGFGAEGEVDHGIESLPVCGE